MGCRCLNNVPASAAAPVIGLMLSFTRAAVEPDGRTTLLQPHCQCMGACWPQPPRASRAVVRAGGRGAWAAFNPVGEACRFLFPSALPVPPNEFWIVLSACNSKN